MRSPPDVAGVLAQARGRGDLSPLLELIPYARFLGLKLEMGEGDLTVRMPGDERLTGNPVLPALHGGAAGALMECAAIFQLVHELELTAVPKTINITIDYLRSGRIVDTYARASITKHGRRVANVQVRAWQADEAKPIAMAQAHFLLKNA